MASETHAWLRAVLVASAVSLLGCEGQIHSSAGGGPRSQDEGPKPKPTDAMPAEDQTPAERVETPMRRLGRTEYLNTVADAFGLAKSPDVDLPTDEDLNTVTWSMSGLVTDTHVGLYLDAAETIAAAVVAKAPALLAPCTSTSYAACVGKFTAQAAKYLFRRPATQAEVAGFQSIYSEHAAVSPQEGLTAVVQAMLLSPRFLYHVELGEQSAGTTARLTDFELAARLSYFFWQRPPDEALFAAALKNELSHSDVLQAQVKRLAADPRAQNAYWGFVRRWLHLDHVEGMNKDPQKFPNFADQWPSMVEESRRFVMNAMTTQRGTLASLLLGNVTFINDRLATVYDLAKPGSTELVRTELPPTSLRVGLLTQGAFLAGHANQTEGSLVQRGLTVRERLLCDRPPPPPGMAITQEVSDRLTASACKPCHAKMDPIGKVFERFDAIGRDTGAMMPMSVKAGEITDTMDADGTFASPREMMKVLAQSQQVRDCTAVNLLRFALGRQEGGGDELVLKAASHTLDPGTTDKTGLVDAFAAVAASEAFATVYFEEAAACEGAM